MISGARVFSVFTREWLEGDVAIAEGRVAGVGAYAGGERVEAGGRPLVPGFIDAHVHLESSKLMVDEFARVVLSHGTTAVVSDPHEIANVLGTDGIHWLLDVCEELPLDVYVMAPSCVPASPFESPRRPLSLGDMESILRRRRALGVAEMMNFPAVIAGDPAELAKLALRDASHVDGHAPGVMGPALQAYAGGRHPLRPRGVHLRGGAGQAARGPVGADPRGVERPQPRRPPAARARVRAGQLRVLHRRPRAGLPGARGAHGPDVPRRRRARHRRPRTRSCSRPSTPPAATACTTRAPSRRATAPTSCCSRTSTTSRRPRVEGRRAGRRGRSRAARSRHRRPGLGAPDGARRAGRPGGPAAAVDAASTCA